MADLVSMHERAKLAFAALKTGQAAAPQALVQPALAAPKVDTDVPADLDTILASTEKLLAVNRGEAEPDERDSLEFRRVHTPDKLFAERIQLDANKLRRVAMRRVARHRNLKAIGVAHWDPYTEGLIVSNPLSTPLEEINPLSLVEQARRITAMGPGGIPSDDSITPEMQTVHPSQFGFISAFEGPESSRIGVDVRLAHKARIGSDGNIYNQFLNRKTGKLQWRSPGDLVGHTVGLPE